MIGAFLGFKGLMLTVFLGSFVGAAVGLTLVALRKATRTTAIPFGTFLGVGGIAVVLIGAPVWRFYVERSGL
jgi:prepilin signal peptidase PulO-like enzyme (type II secretory pathway)